MHETERTSARVLVIDDEPDAIRETFDLSAEPAHFEVVHPDEITGRLLGRADLVLVDFVLNRWPARNRARKLGLRPENGVALAAMLRESSRQFDRPTGFTLHTGAPEDLWITPAEPRVHVIARAYNLDWVFLKEERATVPRQAAILAAAIQRLPDQWPLDDRSASERLICGLLALGTPAIDPDGPAWAFDALRDVLSCRPPMSELSEPNHGLLLLRWLLQRIIPYPCFLYDTHRLAARLGATHSSVLRELGGNLTRWLERYRYCGVLAGFNGERWWRSGVELGLWELSGEKTIPLSQLHAKLAAAGVSLEPSPVRDPVICIDQNYRQLAELVDVSASVRIQPDDWPPFAAQAWTTISLAREQPRLNAVVIEDDRDLLDEVPRSQEGLDGRR